MIVFLAALLMILGLIGRMVYLMVFDAEYYQKKAEDLHERERKIKAARGEIIDTNGTVLATNRTVCTISVIHSQIKEPEVVIKKLSKCLGMEEAEVRKRVEKVSSMERIKTNVDKETGDKIREMELAGVKVDEDFKRYYPYNELASKVIGFTGGDNQGIIGLEVRYEDYLKGSNGRILTTTDARGIELEGVAEDRVEPVAGKTLQISMDYNIQMYAQQMAEKVMEEKQAVDEVYKVSHRQYCTGFYFNKGDANQYYENSGYIRECDFVGVIDSCENGRVNITQRNYFTVHDDLEVLSPGKTPVKLDIPYLINSKGEQTEIANRATEKMYFDYPVSFPPHSIIRKPLNKK